MIRYLRWILLVFLFLPIRIHAQSTSLSLDDAIERFEQHSRQLIMANSNRLESRGEAIQYKAYSNPSVKVNREQLNAGSVEYQETSYLISQPIEILGQVFLRKRSASKSIEAADLKYKQIKQQLLTEIKQWYAEYWMLSQQVQVYDQALATVRQALASARARKSEGVYSGLHVQRFVLERNRYRKEQNNIRMAREQVGNQLSLFLFPEGQKEVDLHATDSLTVLPVALSREELVTYAIEQRPDLKATQLATQAAQLKYKVEKRNRLPDLNVDLGYKSQSDGSEGVVIGGSIKVPVFNRNQGKVLQRRAQVQSREHELSLLRSRVRNQVLEAYDMVTTLGKQWDEIDQQDDPAKMLNAARAAYQEGRYSLVELLDATQAYVTAQNMIYETISEHNKARFELDFVSAGRLSETQ
jgi:cobalt-zinc-cadmium efflux system outer membrane protein